MPDNNTTGQVIDTAAEFFALPKEILRNYIHWLILKSTGGEILGSTKVLTLCRQIYEEAIVYLKPCSHF